MKKTNNEILTIVYNVVLNNSDIPEIISGNVFKTIRKTDSQNEDCVISTISGITAKFLQDGFISVKIFYDDIFKDNTYYENSLRGEILEKELIKLSELLLKNNELRFEVDSVETYTEKVIDTNQHFAILKINFKNLTQ
jgi:hypothetical protein